MNSDTKVTLDLKAIEASDEGEAFKERPNYMAECQHTTPQMEDGYMVCPLCGERAETVFRDDGTQYLGYE